MFGQENMGSYVTECCGKLLLVSDMAGVVLGWPVLQNNTVMYILYLAVFLD